MKERGHFVYRADDGTIMISFEKAGGSVPIETLLPDSGRGEGFGEFKLADYLGLADLVLAEPQEFAEFCRSVNPKGHSKDNPMRVSPPAPNVTYLKLRDGKGLLAARTAELFTVVAAYWQAKPKSMALEPGLVAGLWHRGLSASAIIKYVRDFTGSDGELHQPAGRGPDIMNAVFKVFQRMRGLPENAVVPKDQISTMIDLWVQATRSAPPNSPELSNAALHWADYRRIGLVDQAGLANLDRVKALAERVFADDANTTFADAATFADTHWAMKNPASNAVTQAARAQIKKKRKQGKLNRKRGSGRGRGRR